MTMSDKELLELAAKAAGYLETASVQDGYGFIALRVMDETGDWTGKDWNPLTSDGDALRLAVKLKMRIGIDAIPVGYIVVMSDDPFRKDTHEPIGDDPYAATRRAIVRAAAEIGESM